MKTQLKREITAVSNKKRAAKSVFQDCNIETLIRLGAFQSLCITEGYYLIGVEKGYWLNVSDMFKQFQAIGLTYSRCSYFRFRSGEFYYVPAAFVSALAALVGVGYPVAYSAGISSAYFFASRHPSRWVIPSYIVSPTLGA